MKQISRREVLTRGVQFAGAVGALGATGMLRAGSPALARALRAASATSMETVSVQLPWIENVQGAGEYIALTKGFYAKQGLTVSILSGGPNVSIEPTVVSGKATVGISSADAVAQARLKGAPLKIIGAGYQKNPYCIISSASKPISSPQELVGKKIGVSASNLTPYNIMLKLNKVDPSKVTVVPVQFDPTPLAAGEVDAWLGYYTSEPITLKGKGFHTHVFLLADFGYHIWGDVYEVTEATLANHKEELVAFMRAERQGWGMNISQPTLGASLAVHQFGKSLGLDYQEQVSENKAQSVLMQSSDTAAHGLFWMSAAGIAHNLSTMHIAGIPATASVFSTEILEAL